MKAFLKVAAVNAAVLLAGFLVAEAVFGNWFYGPDYRGMNIPRNTVRVFDIEDMYPRGRPITYTRDKHGLRGAYESVNKIDILTLGGSTTNQLYVDDEETWHAEMARRFVAAGKKVSVVNAAIDGQSTRGHIAVFERWFPLIEGLQARYVLVYAGINDVGIEGHEKYDQMRSPDTTRQFADAVKNRSALYAAFKIVKGMLAAYNAQVMHGGEDRSGLEWVRWRPVRARIPAPDELTERLQSYDERLRRLTAEIRKFGARAIYVTQPSADARIRDGSIWLPKGAKRKEAEKFYRNLEAFNRTMMDVCEEVGAICIDLAREMEFEDRDFYDRVHNTGQGAKKIGRYLFEKLNALL